MSHELFRGRRVGEIAVVGLGKSGGSVATLLARDGHRVYASDAGSSDAARRAAASLARLGAAVDVGHHDLERIARAALVVTSPGVPPAAPPLAAARAGDVPVVGEIEVALHYLPGLEYIAVTGTNGKTTTTALVGHLLRALGHDVVDAGNIGTPLADVALMERKPDWVALEMSSFQLHDTPSIRPTVGVLTNLSPDHLDRYENVDEYYADKGRIFANATEHSIWVINTDQVEAMTIYNRYVARDPSVALPGDIRTFSLRYRASTAYFDRDSDELVLYYEPLLKRSEFPLLGDHNVANALAAAAAVAVADEAHRTPAGRARIADGLRSFHALEHRLEPVGVFGAVEWINDSKATNLSSTLVAMEGMVRPYVLLLGGRHKGESYAALAEPFRRFGKAVLAYGEAAPIIERDLAPLVKLERLGSSFEEVVDRARALADPGDAVLLSPACSSYDMFDNYQERGAEFRRLAARGAK